VELTSKEISPEQPAAASAPQSAMGSDVLCMQPL
jgi:hypothetical protein